MFGAKRRPVFILYYRSLHVSTEQSTSIDGILPHKLSWRLYLFHYTYLRTTKTRSLVHTYQVHHTYNVLGSINYIFSGSETKYRQNNKTNTLGFKFYYFVRKIELTLNFTSTGTRKIAFETQGYCEYLRRRPISTPTATLDTNYYNWLHIPIRPQRHLQ